MSFSIDHILHRLPARSSATNAPQTSAGQCYKYWLGASFLPLNSYVVPAPFTSASYLYPRASSQLPILTTPRVSTERGSDTSSSTESGVDSDTEQCPQGKKLKRLKKKKTRTIFTTGQLQDLERYFSDQKYLSKLDRSRLASQLGLKERQVKTWYQNRRTRWKKDCSNKEWSREKEISATNNYSQYIHLKSLQTQNSVH